VGTRAWASTGGGGGGMTLCAPVGEEEMVAAVTAFPLSDVAHIARKRGGGAGCPGTERPASSMAACSTPLLLVSSRRNQTPLLLVQGPVGGGVGRKKREADVRLCQPDKVEARAPERKPQVSPRSRPIPVLFN
jgi:hypothetical protein